MSYATISECEVYRYLPGRWVGEGRLGLVLFLLLNPSTADAIKPDATLRRGMGYARSWGYSMLEFVNLFAFRTAYPRDLKAAYKAGRDVIGPENDRHIFEAARRADLVIAAWGAHPMALHRYRAACQLVTDAGKDLHCIDTTDGGQPNHPLMLKAALTPRPWKIPEAA